MNDALLVLGVTLLAAVLTYLGAPLAEALDVPQRIISGALQFAAGILTAMVAFSLMPPAILSEQPLAMMLAFFVGGTLYVVVEYTAAQRVAARPGGAGNAPSFGLYFGVLVDMLIDGALIGIGATLSLRTGLLLALGVSISTAPLAFVTTATAKRQGVPRSQRRWLAIAFFACIMVGALLGYLVLRNQPIAIRLLLVAFSSGFLITTITQSMIPEANREGEPSYAGIMYVAGLSLYAFMTLGFR